MTTLTKHQQELVAEYLPVAERIAIGFWRRAPHQLDRDELISVARLGLIRGVLNAHKHSPEAVENYLARKARGAILDQLRVDDYVPRSARELEAKTKRLPEDWTDEQKAAYAGVSLGDYRKRMRWLRERPVSAEIVGDHHFHSSESSLLGDLLAQVVANLPAQQQLVLALHYVHGEEIRSIAQLLDVTESKASSIHTQAVLAVHTALRSRLHEDAHV